MHKWKQLADCNSTPNLNQITMYDKDSPICSEHTIEKAILKNTSEMDAAKNTLVSPEDA